MTKQLLIYEQAVMVSKQHHGDWSIKSKNDFAFASAVNSVPLTAVEFPAAAAEYAIVFAGSEDAVMPAILLGVRDGENLYVDDAGGWRADYVPAFLRRYPFVFSSRDEGQTFTLCIDEEYPGFNQDGLGERLFDSEGEQTQYLGNVLEFLKAYQTQFRRTAAFCSKLQKLDLLEPMQAQFQLGGGDQISLSGFMAVSRERVKALSDEELATLVRTDEMELLYLHLHSMRNVSRIAKHLAPTAQPGESAPSDTDADAKVAATGDDGSNS